MHDGTLMRRLIFLKASALSGGSDTASGAVAKFTTKKAAPLDELLVNIAPVQSGTGEPSLTNQRPITGWDGVKIWVNDEYDPTADPTVEIIWSDVGTVYGGQLNVTTGVLTRTLKYQQFTASALTSISSSNKGYYSSVTQMGNRPGVWFRNLSTSAASRKYGGIEAYCNCFPILFNDTRVTNSQDRCVFIVDGVNINSVATFISAVSDLESNGGGLFVCFLLKTPTTYQLTPQEVTALLGINHVWADTGNVSVTYSSPAPDWMKSAIVGTGRVNFMTLQS